jgi:RNA polymerase-binding transcription factor DksA
MAKQNKNPKSKSASKPSSHTGQAKLISKTGAKPTAKTKSVATAKPAAKTKKSAATAKPVIKLKSSAGKPQPSAKAKPVKKSTSSSAKPKVQPTPAKATAATSKPAADVRANPKAALRGKPVAARKADDARTPAEKQGKEAKPAAKAKTAAGKKTGKAKAVRPIAFTLDEALEIAKTKSPTDSERKAGGTSAAETPGNGSTATRKEVPADMKQENRVLGAASIADILGYSPSAGPQKHPEEQQIPPKFAKYYKLLVELRDHVVSGLDLHTKDTLKRSTKDDTGNLSAYSQHMADAGTDTFDRDFALSLVSSEQDALYEIEDAIKRIKAGTYGVCEITGKPIKKERLLAVPFTRYSVEGQVEFERTHRKSAQRGGVFAEAEDSVQFMDEDADE